MTIGYGFEIDFLPVGNGDNSGDAIALRYGESGNYKIMVYDGGTKEAGEQLVDHIQTYYGTTFVDDVVCSHPDADHASGLSVVLERLDVGTLWMNRPWNYSAAILDYFKDGRITDDSLVERLKKKMSAAYELEKIAKESGVPIKDPFQGQKIGEFVVLSPEEEWYIHELIADFEKSPDKKSPGTVQQATRYLTEAARKVISWVTELWHQESLREDVETSAENESSVVLFAQLDGSGVLLTGDAGLQALHASADFTEGLGFDMPANLLFAQIPHHGSRHNVSTSVLDRLVGLRKEANDGISAKIAYVSAGKESTSHPRKMVLNAFIRRGCSVVSTKGRSIWYSKNMPGRTNWGPVTPHAFSERVEAWD